jgi:CRISPR-associated protein Cmr6
MPEKPKPKPKPKQGSIHQSSQKPSAEVKTPNANPLPALLSYAQDIPLMFQAQIDNRGKIQYAGNPEPASKWVDQWLRGCPPIPKQADDNAPEWKRQKPNSTVELPKFGSNVCTQPPYTFSWRFVTNSGQDGGLIRPVIGAKGLPFFPGSSMKGAFSRACETEEDRKRYCGGEEVNAQGEKSTVTGKLRFHGGYPIDMESWAKRERLVDVVHGQQPFQVIDSGENHTVNVQISLYQPKYKFGISSNTIPNNDPEWAKIWSIWERALAGGLGSRVSAGYGYVEGIESQARKILSVHLSGKGLTSQLLNRTAEFRPNMFKAALRGHTLRILAGITDVPTARLMTNQLWGGIEGGAIVGRIGINFLVDDENLSLGTHTYRPQSRPVSMSTYNLENGRLDLLQVKPILPELKQFLRYLVQFSCLIGGFGKSWRRIHHNLFYKDYFKNGDKPMIGCHWEILAESKKLWVPTNNIKQITSFLDKTKDSAIAWLESENQPVAEYVQTWREVWHPNKVQVWGRLKKKDDTSLSEAVQWFHGNYDAQNSIKGSELTGWSARRGVDSRVGRIWHRMYPRYVKTRSGELVKLKDEYVELLTIFPDGSELSHQFLEFLKNRSSFDLLWRGESQ